MKKVITYGTYDMLHQGHINLLRRAKDLGDYLIVGVTSDGYDLSRGKLNVRNNVMERVENVKATALADEVIIEEYTGQKIEDIQKYDIDIFAIGSDWEGQFDYLKQFCQVVYLPRTEGVSSTQIRSRDTLRLGIIGTGRIAGRFVPEMCCVNGVEVSAVLNTDPQEAALFAQNHGISVHTDDFGTFLGNIDAAYIATPHLSHYEYAKRLLDSGKHVLCETPLTLDGSQTEELFSLARKNRLVLMEANKTAFFPAFNHLVNIVKSGLIGSIVDIESSISTLVDEGVRELDAAQAGGSVTENISFALLPIFRFLGTEYRKFQFFSAFRSGVDVYTKGILQYDNAVASFKLGLGVKTEGNLVISGTKGYAYIPAPWWKPDYFELRYEDINRNRKYFYAYDGEGLRYELKEFVQAINNAAPVSHKLPPAEVTATSFLIEKFRSRENVETIKIDV